MSRGFSLEVAAMMSESPSISTVKQYNGPLRDWQVFCNQNGINPFQADAKAILDFLGKKFKAGAFYGSLREIGNIARFAEYLVGGPNS